LPSLPNHAFAAAKGAVVYGAVTVVGKRTEIVDPYLDEAFGEGPAQNAILEKAGKEAGKDSNDLKAHRVVPMIEGRVAAKRILAVKDHSGVLRF
jgi:hypothetical protein